MGIAIVILVILLAMAYLGAPLWVKLIIFVINCFVFDPIPLLDEVFMVVGMINDIRKVAMVATVFKWISEHKVAAVFIGIGIFMLLSTLIGLALNGI